MSRSCANVVAIDYSAAFIEAAKRLVRRESVSYERLDEGHLKKVLEAHLPDGAHPERVHFEVGDATKLRPDLGVFDRVHAANLLCRLPEPERLLRRLPELVVSGGELILATPCTWLGEFTPPENWPDGPTLDWLQGHLGREFELLSSTNEPFLIRETARKFQWTSSQLSHWRRR
jgi:SAM-dependent methyltransferase